MNMKLNPNLIRQPISDKRMLEGRAWEHPWNSHMREWAAEKELDKRLKKPNPPSKEAVKRAKFIDRTYHWKQDGDTSVRHGDKRSNK